MGVFYGVGGAQASATTVAGSVFTGLSANIVQTMVGTAAALASSGVINKALVLQAAAADFTGGTGASGTIQTIYRLHTGIA